MCNDLTSTERGFPKFQPIKCGDYSECKTTFQIHLRLENHHMCVLLLFDKHLSNGWEYKWLYLKVESLLFTMTYSKRCSVHVNIVVSYLLLYISKYTYLTYSVPYLMIQLPVVPNMFLKFTIVNYSLL